MVYTVTLNPALDYAVYMDEMVLGSLNKVKHSTLSAGGKGINVSIVLNELGVKSTALGFVAGFTGYQIESEVFKHNVKTDFVHLSNGDSRINIKLKTGVETELNADGAEVTPDNIKDLFVKLNSINDGDILVLAGSVPSGCPNDIYGNILEYVSARKIKTVVDARGELLANTLSRKPDLIKPNLDELAELVGDRPSNDEEVAMYANQLRKMGARNVLVSMGAEGALLVTEDGGCHRQEACKGTPINTVGAGDSMVAGFVAGIVDRDVDLEYALMLGTAAAGATAFSEGLAKKDKIIGLMKGLI